MCSAYGINSIYPFNGCPMPGEVSVITSVSKEVNIIFKTRILNIINFIYLKCELVNLNITNDKGKY